MTSACPTPASRQTAHVLVWFLLFAGSAIARDFSVRTLSDSQVNARLPSIGESGLVAWQGYTLAEGNEPLHIRPDVLQAPPTSRRSDIYVWRDGAVQNVTGQDMRLAPQSQRPLVFGDAVVFLTVFKDNVGGGYSFELDIPPKAAEMRQMESEYPTLFDPPVPTLEPKPTTTDTAAPPAAPPPSAASEPDTRGGPKQHQMWRGSGKHEDVAVYRAGQEIERISPGTRHFNAPVMSESGVAFLCARGWPYGYEMLVWKPGDTELSQLTTNYYYVLNPDMHGNELVFQAWDGNDFEIYLYRFDAGQLEQVTNNQFDDISPVVWNGQIAWIAHPTVSAEIFHLKDGAIKKISEGTQDNAAPSIWDGRVVWQAYDDTDLEIYYFNGSRTIKLTSNTWDDMAPQIRDGLIAWMSYVDNWDAEIMALDLGDYIAAQLTNDEFEDAFPQTAGEKIVWQTVTETGSIVQIAEPKGSREGAIR